MKIHKIFYIYFLLFVSATLHSQVKINNNGSTTSLTNNTAFLDASSSITWNNSTNNGKGLVFPRVDLSTLASMTPSTSTINFNPNRFDGMLVFNTATGTSAIGGVAISPGFYYYRNTSNNINGGTWTPVGAGKSLLSGTVAPVNSNGSNGDFYIDTQTSTLYGPKVAGTWPAGVSLVGAQGIQGPQGPQGPQGSNASVTGTAPIDVTSGVVSLNDSGVTSDKIADGTITGADLNQMGASNGQVLKWNGSTWVSATDNDNTAAITNLESQMNVANDNQNSQINQIISVNDTQNSQIVLLQQYNQNQDQILSNQVDQINQLNSNQSTQIQLINENLSNLQDNLNNPTVSNSISGNSFTTTVNGSTSNPITLPSGPQGNQGPDGMSAYQVWLNAGNTGTEEQFLLAIRGAQGPQGLQGPDGMSAYQVWLNAGNTGTVEQFLLAIRGVQGPQGIQGPDGLSAYQSWLNSGNEGTEQEFLATLKGPAGNPGPSGSQGSPGSPGLSVYQIAQNSGFTGSEVQFIESLKGDKGDQGEPGIQGEPGTDASVTGTAPIDVTNGVVSLSDVGVTTAKLADTSVTTEKIADSAITMAKINQSSATAGQVIKWNGTSWAPAADDKGNAVVIKRVSCAGTKSQTIIDPETPENAAIFVSYEDASGDVISTSIKSRTTATSFVVEFASIPPTTAFISYGYPSSGTVVATGPQGAAGPQGIQGPQGPQGDPGLTGANGKSAYQVWVESGNTGGTTEQFLASLKGEQGIQGIQGTPGNNGINGSPGAQGEPGLDGKSAYQVWVESGNTGGTTEQFLASLKGEQGIQGIQGIPGPAGSNASVTGTAPIDVTSGVVSLSDEGITTSKLADASITMSKINQAAATTGQVIKWNGSSWSPSNDNGDTTTASNGLTLSNSNVVLGGNLSSTTTINQDSNNLTFSTGSARTIVDGNFENKGAQYVKMTIVTEAVYAVTASDNFLLFNGSDDSVFTLPSPSTSVGRIINIVNKSQNQVTFPVGTIHPNMTLGVVDPGFSNSFICDGQYWFALGGL